MNTSTRIGRVVLTHPVMTAAGTSGHGAELAGHMDLAALGAVVVKSVSAHPWDGNPAPRLLPLLAGMLNSVGLQNPGIDSWFETDLPALEATGARVVVSIWGFREDDFEVVASAVAREVRAGRASALVAVEANISCPNVEDRRRMFAHSSEGIKAAVGAAGRGLDGVLPLWVKLSPNVSDLADLAGVAADSGADAVTLINTVMGMAIDPASGRFRLGGGGGGLSGPAIRPIAVRAVYEVRAAYPDLPIVGVGGVTGGADVAELIAAGADAVQVGTVSFAEPGAAARVADEFTRWLAVHGLSSTEALKGRAHDRH